MSLFCVCRPKVVNVYNPFKNSTEVTSIHMRNIGRIKKMMVHRMNDLNGYPLRVSIFPARMKATPLGNGSYSGPDGFILSTLARRMNFKPVTSEPKDGKKYGYKTPNGSFTGTLGDLINDRADISFNSVFIKDYETTQVRFTRPIDFDKLCLVVAKSGLRPHWKGMFLAFSVEMWLAMLFTYSFSITFWCLLRKVNYGRYSLALTTLDLYRIFIMLPIDRVPAILSERVALVSFLWFSLSTATIFQASMVKFLSYPSYEPDIDTLEEVADKNLPILTASQNLRETFESDEPVMKTLYDNFQVVHDKNVEILSKVAYEGKAAALGRMNDLEEKIATSYVKNNLVLLHIVADCPKAYHIAYMLPYDSPFLESINKVISIFVESGIIHSWYIHSTPFRPLSDYHQTQETYKPLTMSNVVIAFIVLGFGAGLSFLAFGAELLTRALLGNVARVQPQLQYSFDGHLARRSRVVYETTRNRIGSDKPLKLA
ncbi:glutamate receptor U1-like [Bemisia tabaci]|uniref:glutamate receptor U1-like n=1 Tax=Bemisia tabaci TaxID=7038 RepID=UPI003B27DBCD